MKRGRKEAQIDKRQFEALCSIQCTEVEICKVLDVVDKTLCKWCKKTYGMTFEEVFKIQSAAGKASLRRKQYDVAMQGNPTLLVWLGKQWLGQKETPEYKNDDRNINIIFTNED